MNTSLTNQQIDENDLYYYSSIGDASSVLVILDHGALVDTKNKDNNQTPLMVACIYGHTDCATLLISRGASLNTVDDAQASSTTALMYACTNNRIDCVRLLLAHGADAEVKDCCSVTPLMSASRYGYTDCISELHRYGADINDTDAEGMTALHWACFTGQKEAVIKLLEYGAILRLQDIYYKTALMNACIHNHLPCVEVLLSHKDMNIDIVNLTDDGGYTALMWACECISDMQIVHILLQHGTDTRIESHRGETALKLTKLDSVKEILNTYNTTHYNY